MKEAVLLAVDDDPENLFILQELIAEYLPGTDLVTCSSADQGLQALAERAFDGALVDVQMPGMDGIEMCRRMKSDTATAHVPVVLVTAHHSTSNLKARGLEAGAVDFITRPIGNEELVAKIRVMLRIKKAEDELREANVTLEERVARRTEELSAARERLSLANAEWEQTFSAISDWVCLIDLEGTILRANRSFVTVEGEVTPGDQVGKKCCAFVHGCEGHIDGCPLREVVASGTRAIAEINVAADRWTSVTVDPVFGPDGDLIAAVHVCRDLTEQKSLERQLRQSHRLESIGQLAGGVAHDFNNILQAMGSYAEFALGHLGDSAATEADLRQIQVQMERAATLTRQLLAFSRQQILKRKSIDLNLLIENFLEMLGRVIGEDVELRRDLGEGLPEVYADPGQIEQVLMNLVVNARDAMPDGGVVTISTTACPLDVALPTARGERNEENAVCVVIQDTGEGMGADTLERVFEPFFSTKDPDKGTGLGLSTVFGIVKQHDGEVEVSSELGKGTTFTVHLPLAKVATTTKAAQEDSMSVPGGTETLLFAEDEEFVRIPTTLMLEDAGYTVLSAPDGEAAIEIAGRDHGQIDMVILDVVMPKAGGRKVLEFIRKTSPTMPVLFTSGYPRDQLDGLEWENAVEILPKPYSAATLLRAVREVLDRVKG